MAITTEFIEESGVWLVDVSHGSLVEAAPTNLSEKIHEIAEVGGGTAQLWIHEVTDDADALARSLGATPYRDLWQVRTPLPTTRSTLVTRAFTVDDVDAIGPLWPREQR